MPEKEDPQEGCWNCKWWRPGTNGQPTSVKIGTCHGYGVTPTIVISQERVPTPQGIQTGMVARQHDLWPQTERFRFCPKWQEGEPTPSVEEKPERKSPLLLPMREGH